MSVPTFTGVPKCLLTFYIFRKKEKMSLFSTSVRAHHFKKYLQKLLADSTSYKVLTKKKISSFHVIRQSAAVEEAIKPPQSETTPQNEKVYSPKITTIVDQISSLNLLEVADLNELLKAKLKIR